MKGDVTVFCMKTLKTSLLGPIYFHISSSRTSTTLARKKLTQTWIDFYNKKN